MNEERFDYQRQADDDEQQQDAAPRVPDTARKGHSKSNTPEELAPDSYWLSEMKRLKAYYEAWDKWANKENEIERTR